jgi:hypothetical protein
LDLEGLGLGKCMQGSLLNTSVESDASQKPPSPQSASASPAASAAAPAARTPS